MCGHCPYVYKNGKRCTGTIVRVEGFKADLAWQEKEDGTWRFSATEPRSHYHVYCSEKGNHAGYGKEDNPQMKLWYRDLPDEIRAAINATTA